MRVADFITKCAVFVGHTVNGEFKPLGTGFFVGYPHEGSAFQYFVTAQHLVVGKKNIQVRVNLRNGQSEIFDIASDTWTYHPDVGRFVDVAVTGSHVSMLVFDIMQISLKKDLANEEILARWDIGVGDEVVFPGLFVHHGGQGRNLPVVRTGTIAAMPDEPITTRSGPISAYLIEARSIGGHSGSPVFVNMLAQRPPQTTAPRRLPHPAEQKQAYYLLGLIRGHLRARDSGEYSTNDPATEDLWVNSGLATVIPAQDIWDTLSQPELEEERVKIWKASLDQSVEVPDSARPQLTVDATTTKASDANPDHREDFRRLVSAAAKKRKPADQT